MKLYGLSHRLEALAYSAENVDSVVLRRCLEGLCEVIDPIASVQDKDVVVSKTTPFREGNISPKGTQDRRRHGQGVLG